MRNIVNKNRPGGRRFMLLAAVSLVTLTMGVSCLKETSPETLELQERTRIQEFLTLNDTLDFVVKESGMYYYEMKTGTGLQPAVHDTAYVFYTVKSLTGIVLDSNLGTYDTLIFPVGEKKMIEGFDEGVSYMKNGGESLFLIPSSLAYGADGYGYIGPYTPLIIKVNLVKVKPAS